MAGPEAEQKPTQDVRKTITILFADIVYSSRLSLTLDPEALGNLLARYFDEMNSTNPPAWWDRGGLRRRRHHGLVWRAYASRG